MILESLRDQGYLDKPVEIVLTMKGAPVTENELIRMARNIREKKQLVHGYWYMLQEGGAKEQVRPFDRYTLRFDSYRVGVLDVDGKYAFLKPIIDLLRPQKIGGAANRGGNLGFGYILDDTDGEGGLDGCCVGLHVIQHRVPKGSERLVITIIGHRYASKLPPTNPTRSKK